MSAALLWRMSYLALVRSGCIDKVAVVTSEDLIADEAGAFERLFERLGLEQGEATRRLLGAQRDTGAAIPDKGTTHDWSGSATSANSYWKDLLDPSDLAEVERLTADVVSAIFR